MSYFDRINYLIYTAFTFRNYNIIMPLLYVRQLFYSFNYRKNYLHKCLIIEFRNILSIHVLAIGTDTITVFQTGEI